MNTRHYSQRITGQNMSLHQFLLHSAGLVFSLGFSFNGIAQVTDALNQQERKNQPLWELGIVGAAANSPEYPGSQNNQNNAIAAPYIVYRGEIFRIGDGSAARAVAVDTSWIEIDLSVDAAFNADSSQDSARAGMPDLDFIFEVGPQIRFKLIDKTLKNGGTRKLSFSLQTRAAFSTDFSAFNHRGWVLHPELSFQQSYVFQPKDRFSLNVSPIWASEKLHDYFYQVDEEFSTQARAEYDARSGYLGLELSAGYTFYASQSLRLFFGFVIDLHQGNSNKDSPLFCNDNNYSAAAGVMWRFYQSEARAYSAK